MKQDLSRLTILFRGAGEMATGVALRLFRSGFRRIVMTEIDHPLAVRRAVSFSEAVYDDRQTVEGVSAVRISGPEDAPSAWDRDLVPVLVDPEARSREALGPDVLIDAIIAKRNTGTAITDAPLVIGLGPGFIAGQDAHFVVETNRGHDLGRVISDGAASPDTGVPGDIAGKTDARVVRAPSDGIFTSDHSIGASVLHGEVIGFVGPERVYAGLDGVLRGQIRLGLRVWKGLKIGDVDPRGAAAYCVSVSEKARALGGAVLEAILMSYLRPEGR